MADITNQFVPVPGQTDTTEVQLTAGPPGPGLIQNNLAPQLLPVDFLTGIKTAITDAEKVEAGGGTALPPPNNFHFVDLTVNVPGDVTGDKFGGTTPGINAQFINLTPDNLLIQGLTPGLFMASGTGDDLLIANGGRNIMDATSGHDVFLGGSGQDTFLADVRAASSSDTLLNFKSSDDLAVVGLTPADFRFSVNDTVAGLEIDAVPAGAGKTAASIVLPGYSVNDIGSKLTLGISKTADNLSFLFVHAN